MKKALFLLYFLVLSLSVSAQEHLSFKNIPIEGSATAFCQKLKSKGFKQTGHDKNVLIFRGDFTGQDVNVAVDTSGNGQNILSIEVTFDTSEEWNTLHNTYNHYKDLYTTKYGEPVACNEEVPVDSNSNTNIHTMQNLLQGLISYSSVWEAPGGSISMSIEKSPETYKGMIVIRYRDTQNIEAKRKSDLEDI